MPASVERCVKHVQGKKGVRSAWAICMAAYKKKMRRQGKKGKS
jgi:hypothetical protein